MMRNLLFLIVFMIGLPISFSYAQTKVDTEVVILIDSSGSISDDAYVAQKEIYRNALISDDVVEMIQSNFNQSASVSIIEFAGGDDRPTTYTITRDFIVSTKEQMRALIDLFPESRRLNASTYTFAAMNQALDILYGNTIESTQRVVNVIIDGPPTDFGEVYKFQARLAELNDSGLSINCMGIGNDAFIPMLKDICNRYITYGAKGRNYQLIDQQMQYMLIDNFSLEIY